MEVDATIPYANGMRLTRMIFGGGSDALTPGMLSSWEKNF
jgi:hypothetical protein